MMLSGTEDQASRAGEVGGRWSWRSDGSPAEIAAGKRVNAFHMAGYSSGQAG